jgi:FlaA1/EpsC-like NDP-sugar epimerase
MGASKRIAELILLTQETPITRMTAVRLCNVIGSQGSVLPLFLDQIARGGPLTVTHADAQRYFITLNQAVGALFAALHVQSTPALLVPDVGAPVPILALAKHLIETQASSATIEFTGLRPGDKLSEQLLTPRERYGSAHSLDGAVLHTIESPCPDVFALKVALDELRQAIHSYDLPQLLQAVLELVPEYEPSRVITTTLTNRSAPKVAPEVPV